MIHRKRVTFNFVKMKVAIEGNRNSKKLDAQNQYSSSVVILPLGYHDLLVSVSFLEISIEFL